MNFINLNCPPLPYFIVGGGCVYRPGDIHERRTIRNVFDLIYVHSGTLYLEQDPFRVELNAGQFFNPARRAEILLFAAEFHSLPAAHRHCAGSQPGEAGKISAADEPGFFQQIHTEKELSILRADAV